MTTALRSYGQHTQILPQDIFCHISILLSLNRINKTTNIICFLSKCFAEARVQGKYKNLRSLQQKILCYGTPSENVESRKDWFG